MSTKPSKRHSLMIEPVGMSLELLAIDLNEKNPSFSAATIKGSLELPGLRIDGAT